MSTYEAIELYILLRANGLLDYLPYVSVGEYDPMELQDGYARYAVEDGNGHYGDVYVDQRTADLNGIGWQPTQCLAAS